MKNIAIILSGCGVFDGAEIHEATLSMLAIDLLGSKYSIFAPNIEQTHVINHLTGKETDEKRNVLVEAARIARGEIQDIKEFKPANFDALVLPGGFGVAKNLCSYAFDGKNMSIQKDVEYAIIEMYNAKKTIGALCISPILLGKIIKGASITIGTDKNIANDIINMGSNHVNAASTEIVVDKKNKIVTTPCYMIGTKISEIFEGVNKLIKAVIDL